MLATVPPQVRAALYWIWVAVYLAVLVAETVWQALGTPPDWFGPLAEWLLLIGVVVGFVAASNTVPVVDQSALPAPARKIIYTVLSALSLLVFLASQAFRLFDTGDPAILDVANAILIILGTAFGFTAASHVVPNPPPADEAQPEIG